MVKERNIVLWVILSLVTCGIAGLVWMISLTDDAAYLNEDPSFSGGKVLLFTIITCGIYGIYWSYKMGKTLFEAGAKKNLAIADNSVLYLILCIFGFGVVNYCVMQSDLNKFSRL